MQYCEAKQGRVFVLRLEHGETVHEEVERFARQKDIVVNSWCELQEELFRGSWNPGIQRFRSPFVFRGLSDKDYRLKTFLMRLKAPTRNWSAICFETFENTASRSPATFSPSGTC